MCIGTDWDATHFDHPDPGVLRDGELWLECHTMGQAIRERGWVPWYGFHMRVDGFDSPVGHLNLRVRDNDHVVQHGGHFGYAVEPMWRGRRYSLRASRLALPLMRRCGLSEIWATCRPGNGASIRTLELLGCERMGVLELPPDCPMRERAYERVLRWRLDLSRVPTKKAP